MKKLLISTLIPSLLTLTAWAATPALNTPKEKVSYTIGYQLGQNLMSQDIHLNTALFTQGFEAAMNKETPALTPDQMRQIMTAFQTEMAKKMMAKQKEMSENNLKASDAYMAKIAKESNVKMIEPGLYYSVQKEGTGPMPTATDTVVVNYSGALINGTVFDSSYKRGKPATFQVNQVIPGWTAALQHMPVGSEWTVYIAPKLAYGEYAPPVIGPNQALVFTIDLISIQSAHTTPANTDSK
jgi:FKBP-type peptidyl-prolyl cis-trans isomerase FklB